MKSALYRSHHRAGFTLVEIMIVVAIIALLAAIAVPNFQRARKRTHATRTLQDLRLLEYSLDRWAIEYNKVAGNTATFEDIKTYLKDGTILQQTGRDVLGHEFGPIFTVDEFPKVPDATFESLEDVAPPEFWSPYR